VSGALLRFDLAGLFARTRGSDVDWTFAMLLLLLLSVSEGMSGNE